jgi:GalNAc-alpha-(1->4)-GalNAc-alpha-(1->3)-diNAcBac-PP-undecaprenol alpha-1,4-N-acetyl-D-galactosaminyltransferase
MKILLINSNLGYGGAEKILAFLGNRLALEGNEVLLLTYENPIEMQYIVSEVNHIVPSISPPPIYAIRRILQIVGVRKVLKRNQPEVIISFKTYPNLISILAATGTRIPVIISERGDPYAGRSWFTKLRDFLYRFADGYVFQTQGAKNYFDNRIQERGTVIPNPVIAKGLPEKWRGEKKDIIVHAGRFEMKQKRQDLLIRAFCKIADKYPESKLVLYGDGEDEPAIRQIISEYRLENRVFLAGVTDDIYESIKKAKMFVLSSDYEGIPNALIEAMSVGLPCVATDCSPGGAAGLIRHMENGMLVKAGCTDELAKAMEFMLDNPQEAERMGQNAQKIIPDLDPDFILNKWNVYIRKIITTKNSDNLEYDHPSKPD